MNRLRASPATTGAGLAIAACSVLMAFLADHHWLVGYDTMLLFERAFLWVQITGLVVFSGGCIWLAAKVSPHVALFLGIAFATAASLVPLIFGGYLAILNVHSWTVALCFPLIVLFLSGALLAASGFLRRVHHRAVQKTPGHKVNE